MPEPGSKSQTTEPFACLERVQKRYGKLTALHDVTLEIRRNEFLTLLGPSGSGKTTSLMCLAGFLSPDSGRILSEGRDITRLPPEQRNFGVVFQGYALFPHMTVAENVAYPLSVRKVAKADREAQVRRALVSVGLEGFESRSIKALSGGQQQRVALARALVFSPALLLLDEPLSALDRRLRIEMQSELSRIHRETGTTFVFVTHDQDEALSLSDRIAVFNKGRIEQIASPRELYECPSSRFIAEFVGETNLAEVEVLEPAGPNRYRVRFKGDVMDCGGPDAVPRGAARLSVRPESADLVSGRSEDGALHVPVRIESVAYFGRHAELSARDRDGKSWRVNLPVSHRLLGEISADRSYEIVWPAGAGFLVADNEGNV